MLDRDVDGEVERLAPDAPVPVVDETGSVARPGGAALAARLLAGDGVPVTLVTALGDDAPGEELAGLLAASGVAVVDLGCRGSTPEKIRIRAAGRPLVRLDRGGSDGRPLSVPDAAVEALISASAVLVSDYGRGVTADPRVRRLLESVVSSTPVVWDPHPRGAVPVAGCLLVSPNRAEAAGFTDDVQGPTGDEGRARILLERWGARGVTVTRGAEGAVYVDGGTHPWVVPAPAVEGGDPCGAGDRFAATAVRLVTEGRVPSEAVAVAVVEAARFVAAGGAGSVCRVGPDRSEEAMEDAVSLAARVRAQGGTVVATGGCFDILHAGHVAMLSAARRLGDCLIVCLNSDSSVRALKGEGRPVTGCDDRRAVLSALSSVDAVAVFDEQLPIEVLRRLQPHVWAKGGDYGVDNLPEAALLDEWGGRVVILPHLGGRSTTGILQRVSS